MTTSETKAYIREGALIDAAAECERLISRTWSLDNPQRVALEMAAENLREMALECANEEIMSRTKRKLTILGTPLTKRTTGVPSVELWEGQSSTFDVSLEKELFEVEWLYTAFLRSGGKTLIKSVTCSCVDTVVQDLETKYDLLKAIINEK